MSALRSIQNDRAILRLSLIAIVAGKMIKCKINEAFVNVFCIV